MASSSKALTIIEEECKHCTPCKTKDKKIDSQYYCTDCEAYYCEECFDPHPRVPYLAKHIVLKHDDMDVWSKVQYKCTTHDKNLEFFCRQHKMLCCHVCVSLKHRSCGDMEYILESSKNICSNGEVGEMLQRTCKELEEIDSFENKFEVKTLKNEQSKSEYMRALKDKIKNLKEIIDVMETKAIDIMTERFEANKKYSDEMCRNLKAFKAQLEDLRNQLTTATAEKECLIFICLKRGENTLDHIQKKMSDMDVNTYKETFKPKFDDRIASYLRDVEQIASMEDEQMRLEELSSEDYEVCKVKDETVKYETDECDKSNVEVKDKQTSSRYYPNSKQKKWNSKYIETNAFLEEMNGHPINKSKVEIEDRGTSSSSYSRRNQRNWNTISAETQDCLKGKSEHSNDKTKVEIEDRQTSSRYYSSSKQRNWNNISTESQDCL